MALILKSREQFVTDEITAIQAALPDTFQFPIGSIVRAIVEAHGGTALWEESLIDIVYNATRLSTSTGTECDTFVADFGFARKGATFASGDVTFSRFTPTQQGVISVGATVSTPDKSLQFAIIADTLNSFFNATLNAYVIPAGIGSASVPVQALTAGTIGNVIQDTLTVITSPVPGIDTVTNPLAFSNGTNAQSDAELRVAFVQYLASLSRATKAAIGFAVVNAVPNEIVEYELVENIDYNTGDQNLGQFWIVADDGTGNPTPQFLQAIRNAVELYRGFTIRFAVYAPIVVTANISATVTIPADYNNPDLETNIQTALETYVNLIPIGGTLPYSRISSIIYNTIALDTTVILDQFNVTNVLLNSGTSDLIATNKEAIKPATPTITIITI
jgi:uncharacterized phage protein gp47/JayE